MTPVIASLSAAIIGAIIVYILTAHKEHTLLIRSKLEITYVAFDEFDRSASKWLIALQQLAIGNFDYEQFNEFMSEKEAESQSEASKLSTARVLMHLYFQECVDILNKYDRCRMELSGILLKIKSDYDRGVEHQGLYGEFYREKYKELALYRDAINAYMLSKSLEIGGPSVFVKFDLKSWRGKDTPPAK